ncbi:hypothetical protein [Salidesulfovibrio onnuriiensis]|uniref:hypothetical protein n=1 Tax=Salidesulfovibrio onnuriiensis TaxID=2583823 RepID=UPI0011C9BE87|nr:hypothetical protein [Salidesulfovibrio onnuriiensis]
MLIHFPFMHVELLPVEPVAGALFFDPGLSGGEVGEGYFRPDGLPVSATQGQALIRDCMAFGRQFKDSSEMAFFGVNSPEEYFSESTSAIKGELMMRLKDEAPVEASPEVANAQFTLMLAWHLEESIIETRGLEKGVRASWDKFGRTLGMEEGGEDEQELALGKVMSGTAPAGSGKAFPWQRVMEALAAFLPGDAVLVTESGEAYDVWQESGIEFTPAPGELGLPQGSLVAEAPAWKLAGRKRLPEKLPWTDRPVKVAVLKG